MPKLSAHQILMLAVMSAVVIALRALPFLVFRGGRQKLPPMLDYLGKVLTAAAIAMLCVYSFAGLCDFNNPEYSRMLYALPATIVTVFLQLTARNPMVSICGGTACYMLLLHFV
ncbi:MAG: AzlD domain-containing protein [Victivallales bacterium]|nr:AzlD domain-containing protein [Victivallales bacterium]